MIAVLKGEDEVGLAVWKILEREWGTGPLPVTTKRRNGTVEMRCRAVNVCMGNFTNKELK